MARFQPKLGKPFDLKEAEAEQRLRMEWIVFWVGIAILALFVALMIYDLPIRPAYHTGWSAISAFGVAAASLGIAGTLSVNFKHAGWLVKGSLGFGVFALVFGVSVWGACRC
ncbi:MAG: hypothetical protein Q8M24_03315 [Pseudolabrys sp.]|nr:hypothetical protein [Pseudolabrys sp.]MDP2294475.1 hypothetical protein [Pseudolabrys sp.]